MLRALRIILWIVSLDLVGSAVYLICASEAGRDTGTYADSAVLFWGDDRLAGPESSRRIAHAVALWQMGRFERVFCVGGWRAADQPSGARQMQRMLIEAGIPADRIVTGGRSYDTVSNLAEVGELTRGEPARRMLLITDRLQVARIRWMLLPRFGHFQADPAGYAPALTAPQISFTYTWRRVQWEWTALVSLLLPETWRARLLKAWRADALG